MTTNQTTKAKSATMAKTQTTKAAPKAATKQAPKVAPKAAIKAKNQKVYGALLRAILEGNVSAAAQRYYVRALEYHQSKKTAFPRAQCASAELPKIEDATDALKEGKVYAPANKAGQRLFDQMIVELFGSMIPTK